MSGIQRCKFDAIKLDACANDNAALAGRWFGLTPEQVEADAGRFVRGKNKGKLRGWVVYVRCTVGGWKSMLGGVVKPGMIFARFYTSYEAACEGTMFDKFFASMPSRVDTQYGHDPLKVAPAATPAKPIRVEVWLRGDVAAALTLLAFAANACDAKLDGGVMDADTQELQYEVPAERADDFRTACKNLGFNSVKI